MAAPELKGNLEMSKYKKASNVEAFLLISKQLKLCNYYISFSF